jgi:hypothetical protein
VAIDFEKQEAIEARRTEAVRMAHRIGLKEMFPVIMRLLNAEATVKRLQERVDALEKQKGYEPLNVERR